MASQPLAQPQGDQECCFKEEETDRERLGDLPTAKQEELSCETAAHRALVCGLAEVPSTQSSKWGRGEGRASISGLVRAEGLQSTLGGPAPPAVHLLLSTKEEEEGEDGVGTTPKSFAEGKPLPPPTQATPQDSPVFTGTSPRAHGPYRVPGLGQSKRAGFLPGVPPSPPPPTLAGILPRGGLCITNAAR